MTAALKDPDQFVRSHTVRTLGRLGKDAVEAVPALAECLKDDVVEVRLAAVEELGNLGPQAKAAVAWR